MTLLTLQFGSAVANVDTCGAYLSQLKSGATDILFPKQKIGEKLRGGIPLCAPIFGPGETVGLKQHGFARDVEWEAVSQTDDEVVLSFDAKGRQEAPDAYQGCAMTYTVKIRENFLLLNLCLENHGETAFVYSPGFHPYFRASDATGVTIRSDVTRHFTTEELASTQFLPPYQEQVRVELDAMAATMDSGALQQYAVWSADPGKYICVEPTMAGNLDDQPVMPLLEPGERREFDMTLHWETDV